MKISKSDVRKAKNIVAGLQFWSLLIAALLISFTYHQLRKTNFYQGQLMQKSLPMRYHALQLATSMDEQKAALIRYLVDGEARQKQTYQGLEQEIEELIKNMMLLADKAEERSIIQQMDWLMDELDAKGRLVLSIDESVDRNYLQISEAIDDIDDLLDKEIVPYVDNIVGKRRETLEESTGELETGIQECLLALSEYIQQRGIEESRLEFVEARANIQRWQNIFIEKAQTAKERRWARMLNENMDRVILKADELMINFDRRMEEYNSYTAMEINTDDYIEQNLLALGTRLVSSDMASIKKDETMLFTITLCSIGLLVLVIIINNKRREKRERFLKKIELEYRDKQMKAIIQSQEAERSRYAQDLHDSYGQLIAVLKLNLQALRKRGLAIGGISIEADKMFDNANNVLQNMSDNLRRICFGLMPQTLKEKGLIESLEELAIKINETGAINVNINANVSFLGLDENKKISLFRICQEWLNNIIKHSDAFSVNIRILKFSENLSLTIEDDGKGFDKRALFEGEGHGWKNIQSRSRLIKGLTEIDTEEGGNGTKFSLFISENPVGDEMFEQFSFPEKGRGGKLVPVQKIDAFPIKPH